MSISDFTFEHRILNYWWPEWYTRGLTRHPRKFVLLVEMLEAKHSSLWWSLSFSQQKKLLTLLEQMKPEERECLLRIMDQLKESQSLSSPFVSYYPCSNDVDILLRLLTRLYSIDRSNLLRLLESMDEQEQSTLIHVMDRQEVSELVRILEQQMLLNEVDKTFTNWTLLKLMITFPSVDRSRLLRLLEGLNATHLHWLLKVLEDSSRWRELLDMMDRLKPQEQIQLIDEILNSPTRMSEMIDQFEQQQQLNRWHLLAYLQQEYNIDDARLLSKAANLMYLHLRQRKGRLSLDWSSLQQGLERLEPLERKQLLRVLNRVNVSALSEQVEILYEEELKGVDVCSMLSRAYVLLTQMEYESLIQHLLLLFVCLLSVYLSEADSQGGFRNLLLDGWWLEFWEIILLAAGDVERNPGPRQMTDEELLKIDARVLGKDALFDVYDAVYDCRPKWRNLCLALRLSPSDLSAIDGKQRGDPDACLQDGLSLWLQGHYNTDTHGPPSWRMLVDAVANSAGGDDHTLALEIAEKHKGTHTQTVLKPAGTEYVRDREESRCGHQHSAAFSKTFGTITRKIGRSLTVDKLRQFLRFFSHPHSPSQRYIQPSVYMGAENTRDILDQLYPTYINPGNIYLLEEIVKLSNSRQCERLLREYTNRYH